MINSVRNTVLAVLNKNNYGYISPSDFNLFAKQAQLEVFDEMMSEYNKAINRANIRRSGTGYADEKKGIEEAMDVFSVTKFLLRDTANKFFLPSQVTTNDDYYLINKVLCYSTVLQAGTSSGNVINSLFDSTALFITNGVTEGDIVVNTATDVEAIVTNVISETTIQLSADIFTAFPEGYAVYDADDAREAEKVSHSKITMLNMSNLTKPNTYYPAYSQEELLMSVFPSTIRSNGRVQAQYLRYPKDPKWTYVTLTNGEPSFDQSQPDYQDFEVPIEDEVTLVVKILQYAGISIRENEVYTYAKIEEREASQQQQPEQ
jgi:hypothetical protein